MFTSYIFKFRVSPLLDKLILGFCNSTVFLLTIYLFKEKPTNHANLPIKSFNKELTLKKLFTRKKFLLPLFVSPLLSGSQISLATFFVLYLKEEAYFTEIYVENFLLLIMIIGAISRIAWGLISDRLLNGNRIITLIIILFVGLLGSILNFFIPQYNSSAIIVITAILFGMSLMGWQGLLLTLAAELGEEKLTGSVTGIFSTVTWTGSMFMPTLFGHISDNYGYFWSWQIVFLSLLLSLSSFVLLFALQKRDKLS